MRRRLALLTVEILTVAACGRTPSESARAIRFVDLFKPEVLHGETPSPSNLKPTVWRFDGPAPETPPKEFAPTRGWQGANINGLSVRDDRLVGRSSSQFPLLRIERTTDLGNRDQFHAIEIRMKASAGATVSLATRGPGPVALDTVERGLR